MSIPVEHIISVVAREFNLDVEQIKGPRRTRDLVFARHLVCFFAREYTTLSFSVIGRLLGDRDRTSIINGAARIEAIAFSALSRKKQNKIMHLTRYFENYTAEVAS